MFTDDIQGKIIDFVRNSPLGVSSSDIAKYLGLNRMTIVKYLAIIQEKALVDFKQLGMAKLWFIPVKINKEDFFEVFITELAKDLNDEASKKKIKKVAIGIAQRIELEYKQFHGIEKLSQEQVIDSLIDAMRRLGGKFELVEKTPDVIIIRQMKSPFGEKIQQSPVLWAFTSALCGVLTARNLDYSRVELKKTLENNPEERLIYIHLKKPEKSKEKTSEEYVGA